MIEIRHNGATILTPEIEDESYRRKSIDGDDEIVIKFSSSSHVDIPVGSTIEWRGDVYTLETPEAVKMVHSENFEYTATFSAPSARIERYKVVNQVDHRVEFPLTATPREHLQLIVDNLNKRESGWRIGDCIEDTERLITYDHTDCRTALQTIAEEFHTELHIEGKTVSLATLEKDKGNPLSLQYGEGNGFLGGIGRTHDSKAGAQVVFVKSSDRNIDYRSYGSKSLRLPKGATFTHKGHPFKTDEEGLSVRFSNAPSGSREEVVDLSNIYPSRVGVVSEVIAVPTKNEDGEATTFYDFTDTTIPDELDFDEEVIEGETLTIIFQSGMLAGREFEVKYNAKSVGEKKPKRFEIIQKDEDGVIMPGGVFVPKAGDKYAVFHSKLPQSYINEAEQELLRKACDFLIEERRPRYTFTGEIDGIWAKKKWGEIGHRLEVGKFVSFTDQRFQPSPLLVRIVGVTEYFTNPYSPKIELSNAPISVGAFTEVKQAINHEKIKRKENEREIKKLEERTYSDIKKTKELIEGLELKQFTESISPRTISTIQGIFAVPELQFQFVRGLNDPTATQFVYTWRKGGTELYVPRQYLAKLKKGKTLSATKEYDIFEIPEFTYSFKDKEQSAHLYAHIGSDGNKFMLSADPLPLTEENNLVGLVTGGAGSRQISTLYGFTEITPGQITTDRIRSVDGLVDINLLDGDFIIGDPSGKTCLAYINGVLYQKGLMIGVGQDATTIEDAIKDQEKKREEAIAAEKSAREQATSTLSQQLKALEGKTATEAQLNTLTATINNKLQEVQKQVDGEVSNWFGKGAPNASKKPESEWPTNAHKARHIGDTYTSIDKEGGFAGISWRYTTKFTWEQIADTQVTKALKLASDAKSTADGKSTTYYHKPNGYQEGDSWLLQTDTEIAGTTYKAGTIVYAHATRESGFVQADWHPNAYITQAEIDSIQIGGRNLAQMADIKNWRHAEFGTDEDGDFVLISPVWMHKKTWFPSIKWEANTQYTVSVFVKTISTGGGFDRLYIFYTDGSESHSKDFTKGTKELVVLTSEKGKTIKEIKIGYHYSLHYHLYRIKIEKGNKATDYSPASEDIQAQIDEINAHPPRINPETKNWEVWQIIDGVGRYVDTGDTSKGDDGKAPKIVDGYWHVWNGDKYVSSGIKAKGEDGIGISRTEIRYAASSSGSTPPSNGWSKQVPALVKGKYLWTKMTWHYSDGTTEDGYSVSYIAKDGNDGHDGNPGKDGVSITSTDVEYAGSDSATTPPSNGWSKQVPSVDQGRYLWTRMTWHYSDGTTERGYSVSYIAHDGAGADPEELNKLRTGLSNANTLIKTLQTITDGLKDGKLDASKFQDVSWLIDAFNKGKTQVAGGLILSKAIVLSNDDDKPTSMLSGYDGLGGGAFARAGIKDFGTDHETAALELYHNGDAKLGDMHVINDEEGDDDRIEFVSGTGDDKHIYMQFGGQATSESEMVSSSTKITRDNLSDRVWNEQGTFAVDTWTVKESNSTYRCTFTITHIASAEAPLLSHLNGIYYWGGTTSTSEMNVTIYVRNSRNQVKHQIKNVSSSVTATVEPTQNNGGAPLKDKDASRKINVDIPSEMLSIGDKITIEVEISGFGTFSVRATNIYRYVPYDTSKSLVTIAKDKISFFFSRQKYILFNYLSEWLIKVVGNVKVQGKLEVTDELKAGHIDTSGAVLCGGRVNANGIAQTSFGKYKNEYGRSDPKVSYNYSTRIYTVYHSIGNTNYVPFVNSYGDVASPIVSDISSYSFRVYFTLQSDRNGKWPVPFTYICYKGD